MIGSSALKTRVLLTDKTYTVPTRQYLSYKRKRPPSLEALVLLVLLAGIELATY